MAADHSEPRRIGPQPTEHPDREGHQKQRRQDALGALGVENSSENLPASRSLKMIR